MLRVGLTGGTGSGKSTVARRLAGHGAVVVDADALAREVVAPGTEGLGAVVAEFGATVLAADGSLDRAALAAVVFADPDRRTTLEAITHPLIARRTAELVAAAPPDAVLVHDVPLLVEKRMGPGYHLVVVVDAPVEERVRRLVGRGMPEDDARRRIGNQASDADRRAAADVWLANDGSPDELGEAVDRLWSTRLVPFRDNLRSGRPAPLPASDEDLSGRTAGIDRTGGTDRTGVVRRLVERLLGALGERAGDVEADGAGQSADTGPVHLLVTVRDRAVDASFDQPLLRAGWAPLAEQDRVARTYASCDPGCPALLLVRAAR